MANVIAIVGIGAGALVAIVVQVMSARTEEARIRQQSADARVQELRDLLDGSVQQFWAAYRTLFAIRQALEPSYPEWSPELTREFGERLARHVDLVAGYGLRVGIRTPEGADVARAHTVADKIIRDYAAEYRAYVEYSLGDEQGPPPPPDEEFFKGLRELRQAIRDHVGVVEPTKAASHPPRSPRP
jgi:hypothetical protein